MIMVYYFSVNEKQNKSTYLLGYNKIELNNVFRPKSQSTTNRNLIIELQNNCCAQVEK